MGLINYVVGNIFKIVALFPDSELSVGTGTHLKNFVYIIDFFATVEIVNNIINKIEQFVNQVGGWYFLSFSKIDQLTINSIS